MVTYLTVAKEMSMEHEVEDGPITIVRVVNPCLYWIRCSNCFSISDIQKVLQSSNLTEAAHIKRGDRVVVRNFDGRLYRGVVQCPAPTTCGKKELLRYKVFLIDAMDTLIVEPGKLYQVKLRTCIMDDLAQQLHLVGIEFGKPIGNFESGFHLDENEHSESQRKQILLVLKRIERVEFQTKRKCESVTFGKIKMWGEEYNNHNLLRVLIELKLAQYREHFMSALLMAGWMDKVIDEQKVSKELLFPSPLDESPKDMVLRKLPPPPPVVFDHKQVLHLKEITKNLGSENLLDKVLPNPKVESFEEMNERYRFVSRYEAILRKNAPVCREQKFEYTTDSCSVVGGFVDVEMYSDRDRKEYPPTSSEEDYINSSHETASSIDLSSHESDMMNENISFSESDVLNTNYSKKLSDQNHSFKSYPKFNNYENTISEKQPFCMTETQVPELLGNVVIASKINPSSENQFDNKGNLIFGRGKMFQKYLSASGRYSTYESTPMNTPAKCAAGQFDDVVSQVPPQGTPRMCSFVPNTDSDIDFIDGFLDETCDSMDDYYGDVIRMNKNDNVVPSPVENHPVRSSPTASLLQPSPVPSNRVQAGELSAEESVSSVPLSRSSSVSSRVSLPGLLPINRRRARREQRLSNPMSDSDSTDSSSQEMSSAHNLNTSIGRGTLLEKKPNLSLNPTTNSYQQSIDKSKIDSELPGRTLSIIGRGKIFKEHNSSLRARGMFSPSGSIKVLESVESPALKELMVDSATITTKVEPNVLAPIKCLGRGKVFQKAMGSTMLPSRISVEKVNGHTGNPPAVPTPSKRLVSAKSTPKSSEVEETETELELSSVKAGSSSDNSLLAKLEAAMKKMSVQADQEDRADDSSDCENCAQSEPLPKPLLSEFVDESDKQEDEEDEVEGVLASNLSDCFLAKVSQALKLGAGLLHGATDILPANYLSNLGIDELIYRNARTHRIDLLTRPQYFGIPAVLKMKNVVFVGPNKTKKSSAFVIPLLSLLMNETYYSTLRKGNGPRCVFVAPTSDRVKTLGRLCSAFCGARLTTITTYGGGLELERKNELAAGCDILITTPRCWLRLLQYPTVTNLSRLCHLVLDRFDILADLFPRELKQISTKVADLMRIREKKNEAFSSLAVQMIFSAEQWSPALEEVVTNLLNNPVVVITSYLEAVLYARIRPKVTLVTIDARFNKLLDLVQVYSPRKIVIICVTANEVTEVRKACSAQYIPIVAHENMAKSLIAEVKPQWCSSKLPPMLICTDAVIHELGITDAQVLIHFSLPESKTSFSERFVVLRDHLPDRILNPKVTPPKCIVHIMFDEACEAPFPFIVDFLRRISVKIPARVIDTVKDIERKKEEGKTTASFCENILQLGSCYKASTCRSRHAVLPKLDSPKGQLMSKGLVKVQIVHVHSAVKYSARILAHNPNLSGSGTWTKYKSEFAGLTFKMASYYASLQNRRQHGRPKVGDLLAYQEDLDRPFFRARIVQITKRDERQEPVEVQIFLMDEGIEKKSPTHTLFELPDDLKKCPDQAVFIYLANLKPVDLDTTWSYAAKKVVDKAVHTSEIEDVANQDIVGKILFSIGRNCVVENLRWCRHMTYSQCFTLDLRQLLLNSGCGIDNPEYSTNLAEICSSANMEFGLYYSDEKTSTSGKKMVLKDENKEPPRWAHLSHEEDFIRVNTVVDESPSLFYIKMNRFHQNLEELERDLSADLNKNKEKVKYPQIGDICAAQNPDESVSENEPVWNRCTIYDISGKEADIFFVDYGDKKRVLIADLYTIPWKFVIKLPFQAIECKLAGVLPGTSSETEWSQDAIDAFHNLITKDWGEFYVKVMNLDLKGIRTGGRCYHIIVLDAEGDVPVLINKKFVDMGYGALSSLDMEETDLFDAYKQIKEFELRKDVDDDDDDEDWDQQCLPADGAVNVPTLATNGLPTEEAGEPSLLDLNFDEVNLEEMMDFMRMAVPEAMAFIERQLPPRPAVVPIAAGPALAEDREVSLNGCSEGVYSEITQKPKEGPDLEECYKQVSQSLPSCMYDAEHPLLVRCAPLKTPFVYWRQDKSTVTIKYMIPCLQNFKLDVSFVSVSFRAILNNDSRSDEYWKRINLFGPVHETSVSERLTVTCLRVTIFKRIQGYLWPRLTHSDSKDHHIKIDPEDGALLHHKDEQEVVEEHFERAYKKFKSGGSRRKTKPGAVLKVEPGSSEEDDCNDDEFFEPDDDMNDPFDPLG